MGFFTRRHRRAPSMGQPLLDQGEGHTDILPPSPDSLPQGAVASFESPNHERKKWLRRNSGRAGSSFTRKSSGGKESTFSYADQMRIQALQEYQRRLAEPVNLSNEVLINFSDRMIAELTMDPYKTSLALYSKTFTANAFIDWAMTQPEVRDQCDALFIGSELLTRGIFLPVSYSPTDALFYSPTLKVGTARYNLITKKKAQVVAAIFGKSSVAGLTVDVSDTNSNGGSNQVSPSGSSGPGISPAGSVGNMKANGGLGNGTDNLRRTSSDPFGKISNSKLTGKKLKSILKRRHTSALNDIQEFEDIRKYRFLPKVVRNGALRVKKFTRRKVRDTRKAYRRFVFNAYAPVRVTKGYLSTRLGPHVLFAAIVPVLFLHYFSNLIAAILIAYSLWRHVSNVDQRQRRDLERKVKVEELQRFQGRRGFAKLHKDGSETADWWSEILKSFWDGWLEFWLNRLLTRILTNVLEKVKPAYLEMLEITTFKLGDMPPKINSSRCWKGNEGETILEWDLVLETKEMNITLSAKVGGSKFAVPVPLRVFVSDLRIAGKLRLGLFWTRRKGGPYLKRLRVSFVDVPSHSVKIKPMTSSFIDVRDLPGVDSLIENSLNKLFTNVLVEPNCVNWDVEKWWINRPAALAAAGAVMGADGVIRPANGNAHNLTTEEQELFAEAERIQKEKGSSAYSMLAAGAGYAKKPTLSVSISVHLAEMECLESTRATSYFAKIKRGAKKHTTEGAKAVPAETLVSVGDDRKDHFGSRGSSIGGDDDDGGSPRSPGRTPQKDLFHDACETAHGRSASAMLPSTSPMVSKSPSSTNSAAAKHNRRKSDFPEAYSAPAVEKKWMCRPVWEEFVRLDAYDKQIDAAVSVKVLAADTRGSRSKSVLGVGIIPNVLLYADGHLHTVQLPVTHPRSKEVVGVIHLRVRCTRLNDNIVAANKDYNPDASLLSAPSTYTKQFALNAADVLSSGASGMAAVARAGLGTINPIPKKYVDSAASGISRAAVAAINEPARQGRWAFRSMYKSARKMYIGKDKYNKLKTEKVTRELEAARRAAEYGAALKASEQAALMERVKRKESKREARYGANRTDSLGDEPAGYHHAGASLSMVDETGGERVPDSEEDD